MHMHMSHVTCALLAVPPLLNAPAQLRGLRAVSRHDRVALTPTCCLLVLLIENVLQENFQLLT